MIDYPDSKYPVREDLLAAHQRCWERLRRAGTWWTGQERLAIAAETRRAAGCALCATRAAALSPNVVGGEHEATGQLSRELTDLVHRIRMDSGRLTYSWFQSVVPALVSEERYVELVAIVANMATVDTFAQALGLPLRPLPEAEAGKPARVRPASAKPGLAWVATIAPEDRTAAEPDIYAAKTGAYIHRALSLVPHEVVGFFDLDDVHYLPDAQLRQFHEEPRDISHAQIELLAARMSALNQCVY